MIEIEEFEEKSDKGLKIGKDSNLNSRIATAVEDLPCLDALDSSHRSKASERIGKDFF